MSTTPSPPGKEKGQPLAESGKAGELHRTLPLAAVPSSPPLVIVRQHAVALNGLPLLSFMRKRILSAIICEDAHALAIELLTEADNGGIQS